jgi:type III secretion protein V
MRRLSQISANLRQLLASLFAQSTIIAVFILLIVSLFLVELPTWLLDFLLVTNLLVSITLLMHGVFLDNPLKLFSFPTILVLTTLFRLALNVSSTKLILLYGDQGLDAAGQVIKAFGSFVVRGDFIVGAIVFAIVAVVNFVVIAKGSARVAEVAARFVLDALPGRQLAIDGELRAGNISKKEAAQFREDLTRESQFFGAMDGAMKWVQGDAIAALVIVFINAVGGVAIGKSRGMDFGDAVSTFGVLAIGDGLVSILPALLVSVSAGVIVTHVVGREKRGSGDEIFFQMLSDPRPPLIAALALLGISFISLVGFVQFPVIPFFTISVIMLFLLGRKQWLPEAAAGKQRQAGPTAWFAPAPLAGETAAPAAAAYIPRDPDQEQMVVASLLARLEKVTVEVDPSLINGKQESTAAGETVPDQDGLGRFYQEVTSIRERVYADRGILLPEITVQGSKALADGQYQVTVRGRITRNGDLRRTQRLIAANVSLLKLMGIKGGNVARHPLDRRSAVWVDASEEELMPLARLGVEVLDLPQFLATEAVGSVFDRIDDFFGLDEIKPLLSAFREQHAHLLLEIFDAGRLTHPEFAEVLRRLVRERVSIRDLKLILEGIIEFAALHSQVEDRQEWLAELHAFLRMVLQRTIVKDALGPGGHLRTFILSPEVEEEFRSAISSWDYSRAKLALDPSFESSLRRQAERMFGPVMERGAVPIVVLCTSDIRPAVQDFFGRQMAGAEWIRTIAYQELDGDCRPEAIGIINIS